MYLTCLSIFFLLFGVACGGRVTDSELRLPADADADAAATRGANTTTCWRDPSRDYWCNDDYPYSWFGCGLGDMASDQCFRSYRRDYYETGGIIIKYLCCGYDRLP